MTHQKTVHLRACGEHCLKMVHWFPNTGSSPRVRRTPIALHPVHISQRFISARAENTGIVSLLTPQTSVHLRACGEHPSSEQEKSRNFGSSPRVRRTPRQNLADRRHLRFISARAENTPLACLMVRDPAVHLRACGEHMVASFILILISGSSPRVRRTRC